MTVSADPAHSPSRGHLRGRALRVYRVATLAEVDRSIAGLSRWLERNLAVTPEFGLELFLRYRADLDALLDRRLHLMIMRDLAAMESG
jgi:hypothetical protein